jgi:hypothetical protein
MGKMVFSASNGKHVPSGGGHYFARGEQGQLIEVLPEVYQQQFEAYLKRLGVKPTTYNEILNKAEQEWHAFAQLRDTFAEDLEQWQTYHGKGVYVEEKRDV